MIESSKHKGLENFFYNGSKKGIKPEHSDRLERRLDRLNAANDIKDMNYPGSFLHQLQGDKEDYLLPLSISVKDMLLNLNVSRKTLSKIINERGAISPDMALRLSRAFDTTPDLWLNLQKNYDLWHAVKPLSHQLLHSH